VVVLLCGCKTGWIEKAKLLQLVNFKLSQGANRDRDSTRCESPAILDWSILRYFEIAPCF